MAYCEYRSSGAAITENVSSENAISNKPICKVLQADIAKDPACVFPNYSTWECPIALHVNGIISFPDFTKLLRIKLDLAKEQKALDGK